MKIDLYYKHNDVNPNDLKDRNVIIIDVLRATSVIATALNNGAISVQTVAEIEQAFALKKNNPNVLLAGERDAIKIDGFNFGNSPLEMTVEAIAGKELIMCTSNGTKAVAVSSQAKSILAASFINMQSIVDTLSVLNEDFVIICSGTNGRFSLDDGLAAGMLIHRISANKEDLHVSDSGLAMALIAEHSIKIHKTLSDCYHLKLLKHRGFQADIDYCLSADIIPTVAKYIDGKFVL